MKNNVPLRLIARIDVKGPNLVKGINFEGLRVLGNPIEFAKHYYQKGIDEIFFHDTVATLYGRNSMFDLVEELSKELFIPLTVSGGIKSMSDISNLLNAGADKVCINSEGIRNPDFLSEAVNKYGSSTIVVAIDVIEDVTGKFFCLIENGREKTNLDLLTWINQLNNIGVGEIILTSILSEGRGKGYDLDMVRLIKEKSRIPIIIHGGLANRDHLRNLLDIMVPSGLSSSSLLHYNAIENFQADANHLNISFNFDFYHNNNNLYESISIVDIKSVISNYALVRGINE